MTKDLYILVDQDGDAMELNIVGPNSDMIYIKMDSRELILDHRQVFALRSALTMFLDTGRFTEGKDNDSLR